MHDTMNYVCGEVAWCGDPAWCKLGGGCLCRRCWSTSCCRTATPAAAPPSASPAGAAAWRPASRSTAARERPSLTRLVCPVRCLRCLWHRCVPSQMQPLCLSQMQTHHGHRPSACKQHAASASWGPRRAPRVQVLPAGPLLGFKSAQMRECYTDGRFRCDWGLMMLPDAGTVIGCQCRSTTTAARTRTAFPRCRSACAAWRVTGPPAWLLTAPALARREAPICFAPPLAATPSHSQGDACGGMLWPDCSHDGLADALVTAAAVPGLGRRHVMPQEDMSRNAGTAMLRRLTECVRSVQRRAPRSGRSAAADASGAPGRADPARHHQPPGLRVCWRSCPGVQVTRSALLFAGVGLLVASF